MSARGGTGIWEALPFWIALVLIPILCFAAWHGGWALAGVPIFGFGAMSVLDAIAGKNEANRHEPDAPDTFWFDLVTRLWFPIQLALIYGAIAWVVHGDRLSGREGIYLMLGLGVVTGATGIVFAHELMHRKSRLDRALGTGLMISVLYGHFVTEHLAVHHRHVGTAKDAATARYNESFYRFFARVLPSSLVSAWRVEAGRMRQRGRPVLGLSNPFWIYWGGGALCLALAWGIGGRYGVGLFCLQAFVAIMALEQINYIEHYGLQRIARPDGTVEPVAPHHSWNAPHRMTNYLFLNLQRHSDHHVKPARAYPYLKTYPEQEAPQLPFGYPLMALIAYNPWLWRRVMNKRVRRWRSLHYPGIVEWPRMGQAG